MKIDLPATLTAEYLNYDDNWNHIDGPGRVVVRFGNIEIVTLPALWEPANHYDSGLNQESEDTVVQETVAAWLREKLN